MVIVLYDKSAADASLITTFLIICLVSFVTIGLGLEIYVVLLVAVITGVACFRFFPGHFKRLYSKQFGLDPGELTQILDIIKYELRKHNARSVVLVQSKNVVKVTDLVNRFDVQWTIKGGDRLDPMFTECMLIFSLPRGETDGYFIPVALRTATPASGEIILTPSGKLTKEELADLLNIFINSPSQPAPY